MANPSGRIGREGEHSVIGHLEAAGFPDLIREGKRAPSLDVISDPDKVNREDRLRTPVESRRRKKWDLKAWVRELTFQHNKRWALFLIERDKRRKEAVPDLMVVPAVFGARLLYVYEQAERVDE